MQIRCSLLRNAIAFNRFENFFRVLKLGPLRSWREQPIAIKSFHAKLAQFAKAKAKELLEFCWRWPALLSYTITQAIRYDEVD